MKKFAFTLTVLILSLAGSLLCCEIIVRVSNLFESQRKVSREQMVVPFTNVSGMFMNHQIHPFNGWSKRSQIDRPLEAWYLSAIFPDRFDTTKYFDEFYINPLGYLSPQPDFRNNPFKKDDVVIGVFGGSVAELFVNSVVRTLKPELAKKLSIPLDRLKILNFSSSAYKQPQQVIGLVQAILLGVPFNYIINIDGFNEIGLGGKDCVDRFHPMFPSRKHYYPMLDHITSFSEENRELTNQMQVEKNRPSALVKWVHLPVLKNLELVKSIIGALIIQSKKKLVLLEQKLQEQAKSQGLGETLVLDLPDPILGNKDLCLKSIAQMWVDSSKMMASLANQIGARYIHILQPNQYVLNSKPLSQEELKIAYLETFEWKPFVQEGYLILQKFSSQLSEEGIHYYDFTELFKSYPETIYMDLCCHFNLKGNKIFFKRFSDVIQSIHQS